MPRRPAPWWRNDLWFDWYDQHRDDDIDPRDDPRSPSFEKLLEECEPRIDSYWDELWEAR